MKKFYVAVIIFLFSILATFAQPLADNSTSTVKDKKVLPPEKANPVVVPKFSASPVIDGKLDDQVWKDAKIIKDFIQTNPGDNIDPSKPTEAFLGYDEKYLYVAFKCYDERDKIRATVVPRDQVFGEDNVRFWLDTYDDQRRAYVLGFNPLGIQQDGIITEGEGADFSVDIVMESKGVIEEWGWSVEVKIPFKSLRYSAGKGKKWGFNAARNIDRLNDEFDSWMPLDRNLPGFINKFGKITGLDEIKTERTLELIPTLTLKETGKRVSTVKFSNPPIEPDFGFSAKYQITPNVTLDATYNPDFADTEADAPVVEANQRFPIFFSEKRPFFLEGVDIFRTPIFAVNTRRIENPEVAAKLTGKIGKTSFGFLAALDEPLSGIAFDQKAKVGVVRLKRDFSKESHYGFLGTFYQKDALKDDTGAIITEKQNNYVGGFDVRWKINKHSTFSAQALATNSKNYFYNPVLDDTVYRNGNALIYTYEFNNEKKNVGWGFGGVGRTNDYRADVGFTRRTNTNEMYGYVSFGSDPKPKNFLIRRNININGGVSHDFQGRLQGINSNLNVNLTLKNNTYTGFGGYFGKEVLIEEEFGPKRLPTRPIGAFFGSDKREAIQGGGFFYFNRTFSKRFSAGSSGNVNFNTFDFDFGAGIRFPRVSPAALTLGQNAPLDPGKGTQWSIDAFVELKPTDKLSTSFSFNKSTLTRNDTDLVAFDSNIFQFRTTYQFSRFVSIKARLDYNTLSSRVFGQYTFGWTPSPGKALYIGYNDNWNYNGYFGGIKQPGFQQLNRTFFVKLSYLFRKSF